MNREAEDRFFKAAKIEAIDDEDDTSAAQEEPVGDIKPSRPGIAGR